VWCSAREGKYKGHNCTGGCSAYRMTAAVDPLLTTLLNNHISLKYTTSYT